MRLKKLLSLRGLSLFVAGALSWSLLAWGAGEALEVRAELANADIIVVLSGSSTYMERTRRAAELFKEGRAPLVVLTNDNTRGGWSSKLQRNPLFVERAVEELGKAGVPAEKIEVLSEVSSSTYDEAVSVKKYAVAHKCRSILIVTSAYHSRRALWTFSRSFDNTGITVGIESVSAGRSRPSAVWWLSINGWQWVGGEYLKLGYYWWSYR